MEKTSRVLGIIAIICWISGFTFVPAVFIDAGDKEGALWIALPFILSLLAGIIGLVFGLLVKSRPRYGYIISLVPIGLNLIWIVALMAQFFGIILLGSVAFIAYYFIWKRR